ncbi:MAG: tetratricopeptide repeat protein [Pseudobdellovibrionaceae bacterium]
MSTKFSKEELKSPDQVTKKLREGFVWTTAHSKLVVGAVSAFIVVGIGTSLAGYFSEKKEVSSQEKYFLIEKSYNEKKRGFEEASRAEMNPAQQAKKDKKDKKAAPEVDNSKKATGDLQKDYGTVVSSFEAFISETPNTKAAQMAALNLSDIYVSYKKNDEALAVLQKVEKGLGKDGVLAGLVSMQMGNILADKADCKGAVEKWQSIVNNKELAFAHDEAKLRMGLCFESMNDLAKAEELYSDISKKDDRSAGDYAAYKEAQKYLRLLKVKKNL